MTVFDCHIKMQFLANMSTERARTVIFEINVTVQMSQAVLQTFTIGSEIQKKRKDLHCCMKVGNDHSANDHEKNTRFFFKASLSSGLEC